MRQESPTLPPIQPRVVSPRARLSTYGEPPKPIIIARGFVLRVRCPRPNNREPSPRICETTHHRTNMFTTALLAAKNDNRVVTR